MHHFFIKPENIKENEIVITDRTDINHMKTVLRMRPGDKLSLCCEARKKEYICTIIGLERDGIRVSVEDVLGASGELPVKIVLFQGLPKGDKMDDIVKKATELGAAEIVPMASHRCVVKLDAKKEEKKVTRWNAIAKNAAKQSGRSVVPVVKSVLSFDEALQYGKTLAMMIMPYEEAEGLDRARSVFAAAREKNSLGIFIGPEGGFEREEVTKALREGAQTVTLGHRILRTETAGMTVLSILMFLLDKD